MKLSKQWWRVLLNLELHDLSMMKYYKKYVWAFVLVFVFFGFGVNIVSAEEYYECSVTVKANAGSSCDAYRGRGHICQIYQGYDGTGVPDFCSDFCVERSDMPKECVTVSVQPSNNPEAHEKMTNKLRGMFSFGSISSFFKEKTGGVSKWWKNEIKCEKPAEPPQMGQVLEVSGEGKAWISRGLGEYRAVRYAPLLGGDRLIVPEKVSLKIEIDGIGKMDIEERTKVLISSGGRKGEQCFVGRVKGGIANSLGRIWNWTNEKLSGEKFEIKTPTVTAGVRG